MSSAVERRMFETLRKLHNFSFAEHILELRCTDIETGGTLYDANPVALVK